jgi:hypothetical protein
MKDIIKSGEITTILYLIKKENSFATLFIFSHALRINLNTLICYLSS